MTNEPEANVNAEPENATQQAGSSAATAGYTATREGGEVEIESVQIEYVGLNERGWHTLNLHVNGEHIYTSETGGIGFASVEDVLQQVMIDVNDGLERVIRRREFPLPNLQAA